MCQVVLFSKVTHMLIMIMIFYQSRCHWHRVYISEVNVQELVWNKKCFFNEENVLISVEFDETLTEKHWQKRQFFFCICHSETTIVFISLWLAHLKLKIYNSTRRYKMSKEIRHIYFYKHDLALSIALYIWHFEWQLVLLYLSPWREEMWNCIGTVYLISISRDS